MFFVSVADDLGRALPEKHVGFFLPSARIRLLPLSEKNCQFREMKKRCRKKTSSFREIKNILPGIFFFACFFRRPHYLFLKKVKSVFYFVALINFSRNVSNVFYLDALISCTKNMLTFFFLKCFFLRPPSLDF